MELFVDLSGGGPLYRQIYGSVRSAILEGRVRPGDRLPATRRLAEDLGVSRTVVLLAFEQLAAEGYVHARTGSGTYVSEEIPDEMLAPGGVATPAVPEGGVSPRLSATVARLEASVRDGRPWRGDEAAPRLDLRVGVLAESDFPAETWRTLAARHARRLSPRYGPAAGHPQLRRAIAAYLRRARAVRCADEQVVITSGSRQAFDLIARLLVDPGDAAVIEEPGYQGTRHALRAAGARIRPVPVDEDGLDPDTLPEAARLACVTPSHQFPTGGIMPLGRRLELLAWAERVDALVVEDDYDAEFQFEARPIESLQGLDRDGRVIYVGTLSKVLSPALRLGYVVLPEACVDPFTALKWLSDRQTPELSQRVATEFLEEGHLDRHLRKVRTRNAERREALLDALDRRLGDRARAAGAEAGLHVLVHLPGLRRDALPDALAAAHRAGVAIETADDHYSRPPETVALIVGYAAHDPATIREAVQILAGALEPFLV